MSLSARRAWIEIYDGADIALEGNNVALRKESVDRNSEDWLNAGSLSVALRKESVDRNWMEINGVSYDVWSLSARRAWIEIPPVDTSSVNVSVALRKESVDRNFDTVQIVIVVVRRSPQGERG